MKNSKLHHWRSSVFFLPWIVLVLSLGLSVVLYYEAWHLVKGKERVYFERQTSKIKEDIINRLDKYVAVLRGGQGLFAASNNVERQEWNNFVRVLDVEQNYPGLVSLSFVDFIPERERDGFIKKTRANDIPNFQTWPQKGRGDAFINIYSEPLNTLRPVLGFDMSSEPKRKEALETARDTGLAAISAKLTLMNVKGSNKTGFVLTIPVYKNDLPHATLIERRTNIQGWIVAGLQSQDFMDSVSNDAANEIDFEIFDGQNMTTESVLHDEDQILHAVDGSYHPAFQEKATIVVGGRPWTLYFTTRSSFGHAVDEAIPAIVLLGGFVASILLFGLIRSLVQTRQEARRLADDITKDLQASEKKYRSLFEFAGDSIYIIDPATQHILDANEKAAAQLGYTREELLRLTTNEIDAPQSVAKYEELAGKLAHDGHVVFEHTQIRKDGSEIPVEISSHVVDFEGRKVFQGFVRNIEERKKVERMKNEFISTVSHELRTPLTSIRGSIGLIVGGATGPVSEEAKPLLDIALNDCERLVRLINDILDVEKIEAGRMDFKMKPTDLISLLKNAINTNHAYADQFDVGLVLNQPELQIAINADEDRLMQVVTNLLSNAVKFSPQRGHVVVDVSVDENRVRTSISDHGLGIPEKFQPRLFEKFAQADSSDARQKGGTGLGLNITKAILEKMGGRIGFKTQEGEGTTFYFDLPILSRGEHHVHFE